MAPKKIAAASEERSPREASLKVSKSSHQIVSRQQPLIVYTQTPRTITIPAEDFKYFVQRLTGLSSASSGDPRAAAAVKPRPAPPPPPRPPEVLLFEHDSPLLAAAAATTATAAVVAATPMMES